MHFPYKNFFQEKLDLLKSENRYRHFQDLEKTTNKFPLVFSHTLNKEVSVWCSNDYMCLSQHPEVIEACKATLETSGVGSGGTRNISGTTTQITQLEKLTANLHKKESALVMNSGYIANLAAIGSLCSLLPDCIIYSDQRNHASIIRGIQRSKCKKVIFPHNDLQALNHLLSQQPKSTPKLITCESIYSMDGDTCDLPQLMEIAQNHGALVYVDEVHAVAVYGETGAGLSEKFGVSPDIIQGNFAKGFGVLGGYIASTNEICDIVRSYASEFIFTTSLPPSILQAAHKSIELSMGMKKERHDLLAKTKLLQSLLREGGIKIEENLLHITPVIIGDGQICNNLCQRLIEEHNIYIQPINYPTVPKGQERVRITITRLHTEEMIKDFANKFIQTFNKLKSKK